MATPKRLAVMRLVRHYMEKEGLHIMELDDSALLGATTDALKDVKTLLHNDRPILDMSELSDPPYPVPTAHHNRKVRHLVLQTAPCPIYTFVTLCAEWQQIPNALLVDAVTGLCNSM